MRKRILIFVLAGVLALSWGTGTALAFTNLQKNSQGPEVLQVQKQLQFLGYNISEISGEFDNSTYRAVIAFQRDQKIKITGVVDKKTYNAIQVARRKANLEGREESVGASGKDTSGNWEDLKGKTSNVPEGQLFLEKNKVSKIITTAKKYIGTPYKYGGTDPKGFDCSGYLQYVFSQNGLKLPRTADDQYKLGKSMSAGKLVEGDFVFFSTYEAGASHCGIYLGKGQFIHASSSKGVRIDKLSDDYWKSVYYGGKHIVK